MASPTNAVLTTNAKGIREDLEGTIYRVAATETPFTSSAGGVKAAQPYHEWQTETVDAPNAGPIRYEGEDAVVEAGNTSSRLGNYVQHFERAFQVSDTMEASNSAGRSSELARQAVLKGIALTRDIETRFLGNYPSVVETPGTSPRASAGALAFVHTNTNRGHRRSFRRICVRDRCSRYERNSARRN